MAASRSFGPSRFAGLSLAAGLLVIIQYSAAADVIWKASTPPSGMPTEAKPDEARQSLPINLPTALQLAQVNPIDIQVAVERTRIAQSQLEKAKVLWLPTIYVGADYARQDGRIQDIVGNVFNTSRSSVMVGAGPYAVFGISDAIYAPLAARQVVRARQLDQQAALNDTMLTVAEAYFSMQQARGELATALDVVKRSKDLVDRTEKLAKDLANPLEVNRAKTELARREQAVETAYERWQTASSDLARLIRLDASAIFTPVEQPHLMVEIISTASSIDELIPIALSSRPELASQQALVQATLTRLKQERMRPLIPSLALRGNATNPGGTLSSGTFGGGVNSNISNFGAKQSIDLQVLWEFQNLGFGNRASIRERQAETRLATLELFRVQDRIAAEVSQAYEQARRASKRAQIAEEGLKNAVETVTKSLALIRETRSIGNSQILVIRPQEVVASIQSLDQAYRDFYGAVADVNRFQFRLYRALGHPAQCVIREEQDASTLPRPIPTDRPPSIAKPQK